MAFFVSPPELFIILTYTQVASPIANKEDISSEFIIKKKAFLLCVRVFHGLVPSADHSYL